MHTPPSGEASHTPVPGTTGRPRLPWLLLAVLLAGCPTASVDDDDSAVAVDDDDSTEPPTPLADVLGVVNLTNVRQPQGTDYVDLGGAFGDYAGLDTELLSPTAYMGTWDADAGLWRLDLGSWPLPALGSDVVLDLFDYVPWQPEDQAWWDAGDRIAAGPYLAVRYQNEEAGTLGYIVDDPLNPGGDAWVAGGSVAVATSGGAEIVDWSAPPANLPGDMELVVPLPGATVETPAAQEFTVEWNPVDDGATVMVVLLQGLNVSYVAHVADSGSHTLPSTVLHDDFGAGPVQLIVSRLVETVLDHPQGDVIFRARSEERAELMLLDDLVLSPAYGSAGQTIDVDVRWFTGSIDGSTTVEFGEGTTVNSVTPDGADPQRATVNVTLDGGAEVGPRSVFVSNGGEFIDAIDAFTILDLDPSDDCAAAGALGPLADGTYTSTTDGLANSLSSGYACIDWSLNGSDAIYEVSLEAGVPVRIAATMPEPGDAALALLSTCGDAATAVACSDDGFEGDTEEILFTPETTGTYYVAVDGYFLSGFGSASSPFELTIETGEAASPVDPPWVVPGTSPTLSVAGSWGAVTAGDVDLGAGITVDSASAGAALTLGVTVDGGATVGPRTLSVDDGGIQTFSNAVYVSALPANDTCAAADAWGAQTSSGAPVTAWAAGTTNAYDEVGCFSWGSPGAEVVHALDLIAGQSLHAFLESPEDTQLYVLSDCSDLSSCVGDASSDDGFAGDSEEFAAWEVPTTGRYYLVVDLFEAPFGPAWEYTLTLSVTNP